MLQKSLTMKKMSVAPAPRSAAAFCALVVTAFCGWSSFSCVTSARAVRASSGQQQAHLEQVPDHVLAVIDKGARDKHPDWSELISLLKVMFSGRPQLGAAELNEVRDRVLPEAISRSWNVEPGQPITLVEEGLTRWQLFFQAWRRWKEGEAATRPRGRGGPREIVSPLAGVSRRFRGDAFSVRQPRSLGAFFSEEFFATSSEYTANAASQEFASAFLATFEDALARPNAASYVDGASVFFNGNSHPPTTGGLNYGFIPTDTEQHWDWPGFPNPPTLLTSVLVRPPNCGMNMEYGLLKISALRVQHANIRRSGLLLPAAGGANAAAIGRRAVPMTVLEFRLCTASAADMMTSTRGSSTSIWCELLQENHFARPTVRFKVEPSRDDETRKVLAGQYDLELALTVYLR